MIVLDMSVQWNYPVNKWLCSVRQQFGFQPTKALSTEVAVTLVLRFTQARKQAAGLPKSQSFWWGARICNWSYRPLWSEWDPAQQSLRNTISVVYACIRLLQRTFFIAVKVYTSINSHDATAFEFDAGPPVSAVNKDVDSDNALRVQKSANGSQRPRPGLVCMAYSSRLGSQCGLLLCIVGPIV
jgi:hypothetical protein